LVLPVEVTGPTYENVTTIAASYLEIINGAASVIIAKYRPVTLASGPYFGIDASGKVVSTVVPIGMAELRLKSHRGTISLEGEQLSQNPKGEIAELLARALTDPQKADALKIVGRNSPTWSELYVAFELVKASVGSKMHELQWISKPIADRFTHTANSYSSIGIQARHGKNQSKAPDDPLDRTTATKAIRKLVSCWVGSSSEIRDNDS
jgi:hypothetical protein